MRPVGNPVLTIARTTYTTTGAPVAFTNKANVLVKSAHVSLISNSGNAYVSLDGDQAGPFIELNDSNAADFPIETSRLFIKGNGGNADVTVVVAIAPAAGGY